MPDLPSGSWEGSLITPIQIEYLRRTHRLPVEDLVAARAPEGDISPQLRGGERVVFGSRSIVGFGLPMSAFFLNLLASYGLQMHHLGVNAILYISCYVALCEGYLGFRPFPSFFRHFFYFRTQKNKSNGSPYSCSSVVFY
ncbi:hypothetical protein D1007_06723 [Hordeum vulgare]|nr:hypothetical protein D1007_06723 [Hordeum vulgare]